MKKNITAALILAAISTTSCIDPSTPTPPQLDQNVAVIIRSTTDTIGLQIAKGAVAAGMKFAAFIDIIAPEELPDSTGQLNILNNLDPANYAGIVIVPSSPTALNSTITQLSALLPVIVVDTPLKGDQPVMTFVGTDNIAASEKLAQEFNKSLSAQDTIIVIQVGKNEIAQTRQFGFSQKLTNLGHTVYTVEVEENVNIGNFVATLITETFPQTAAIMVTDPRSAAIAAEVIAAQRPEIKIATFDATAAVINAIKEKKITATIASNTYQIGYVAITSLIDYLGQIELPRTQYQPTMYIDAQNVDSPAAQEYINTI